MNIVIYALLSMNVLVSCCFPFWTLWCTSSSLQLLLFTLQWSTLMATIQRFSLAPSFKPIMKDMSTSTPPPLRAWPLRRLKPKVDGLTRTGAAAAE
ncbi:hypothetical protein QBC45DRAFT_427850 [Copromyces sp. CBS 386.78]|nr:hypothetical protein QBC45DRAFT_427850 [Copromyces sp. CBS 386.78]